ncbi:MAG: hypothetical protein J6T41_01650 [Neisseriaceae bacterium]|nr:hypothetical protein [Neisseriaceae bacterium]
MNEEFLQISVSELSSLVEKYGVLNNLKKLDLSHNVDNNLEKELEKIIPNLPNVQELYLTENQSKQTALPNNIHQLKKLQKLDLCCCKFLKELPENIVKLRELKILCLSACSQLSSLPNKIELLKNLKALYIDFTNIKALPREIGQLKNLEYLGIGISQISLPTTMFKLEKLNKLSIVLDNEVSFQLLDELVKSLPNIEVLDLSNSDFLTELPNCIFRLKFLKKLFVWDCLHLEISSSVRKQLPPDCKIIFDLEKLQQFKEEIWNC